MSKDPWKHRSTGMQCTTCMWNVAKVGDHPEKPNKIGRCRRHAPTMNGYPVVFENDWCGDHKLDETKLKTDEPEEEEDLNVKCYQIRQPGTIIRIGVPNDY